VRSRVNFGTDFGLAAMAALAGVPLVTRDAPVLREVFGGAALFGAACPGSPLLEQALGRPDPALRWTGQELAVRHTWAEAAQHHLAFYRSPVRFWASLAGIVHSQFASELDPVGRFGHLTSPRW
jgi:hypothetical protein